MTQKEFSDKELRDGLGTFFDGGISHIRVHNSALTKNKQTLLQFIKDIAKKEPDVLFEFFLSPDVLDKNVISALMDIGATVLLSIETAETAEKNDKAGKSGKFASLANSNRTFSKKIAQLNNAGLPFGFMVEINNKTTPNRKDYMKLLEELVNQYPNHIFFTFTDDFAQGRTEKDAIRLRALSRAFELFYTDGRAVPWFKSLLHALKISTYALISDFYEWLISNNYIEAIESLKPIDMLDDYEAKLQNFSYEQILIMQEKFIYFKMEEKNVPYMFPVVRDTVRLHAAFSQVLVDGKERELELSYNPEDLLGQNVTSFIDFYESMCSESIKISVFLTEYGIEYQIL